MKRAYIILIILLIKITVVSAPVDSIVAKKVALAFLSQESEIVMQGGVHLKMIKESENFKFLATPEISEYYILNRENNKGFVIVSADDRAIPILGYANNGNFDLQKLPPNAKKWFESYKNEIRHLISTKSQQSKEIDSIWSTLLYENTLQQKSTQEIAPLIKTQWDQSPYYNTLCPFDRKNAERTVTGCVATAMAQVMKYWNYPKIGNGFHSYNHSKYGTLSASFGNTTYDWTNMPNDLTSSSSSAEKSAIAKLMYHCGISVDMNYNISSEGGSGAYIISTQSPILHCTEYAFKNYFGYKETLKGVEKSDYTNSQWANLLKTELNAGRPIVYAGFGDGGHCFVCDGYDKNNYFHFNWGWSGYLDGYFVLSALNPGAGGAGSGEGTYTAFQQAIIGIEPVKNQGGSTTDTTDLRLYSDIQVIPEQIQFKDNFTITTSVANYGTTIFKGEIGAAVFNEDYVFVNFVETQNFDLSNGYYNEFSFEKSSNFTLVPGAYYVAIFIKSTTENWTIIGDGNYSNLKPFTIYYSDDIEVYSDFTIQEGKLIQGQNATVNVDITNDGNKTFIGKLRVNLSNLDGTWAQDIQVYSETLGLEPNYHYIDGIDFTGNISVKPSTYLMEVSFQEKGTSNWYYAGSKYNSNPIYVIVEAPTLTEDQYEENNTKTLAYNLKFDFNGNNTIISTTGSNFHIGNDIDFYKINLPEGFRYTISPVLNDKYNKTNNQTHTADAIFSISLNNTNNWSETYDTAPSSPIEIENGGILYFKVAPHLIGSNGTYSLALNIQRGITNTNSEILNSFGVEIYPNPANDQLFIKKSGNNIRHIQISDLNGRVKMSHYLKQNFNEIETIDISKLITGIYQIEIFSPTGIETKRLIKK